MSVTPATVIVVVPVPVPANVVIPDPVPGTNSSMINTIVYLQSPAQSSLKIAQDDAVCPAISTLRDPLLSNVNLNFLDTTNKCTTAYWDPSIQIFNGGIKTSLSGAN
jgi:hypothetical protein